MQEFTVKLVHDKLFVGSSPSGRAIVIDPDRQRDSGPGPMELLLLALGACTGTDVASILKKKREKLTSYEVRVTAERREDYPKIWQNIEVKHILCGKNLSEKAVQDAVSLSETKYCSVSAMLGAAAKVTMRYQIEEEET